VNVDRPLPHRPAGEPPLRRASAATVAVVVVLVLALVAGGVAWFASGDDDDDDTPAVPVEPDDGDTSPADDISPRTVTCVTGAIAELFDPSARVELPEGTAEQFDAVARIVQDQRELQFDTIPEPTYVTADEMSDRIAGAFARDYPDDVERADEELYVALGAIPAGSDLRGELATLYGEQVAGYYDPTTDELVVLGDEGDGFDATELTIIAHELEHALADQALGLPDDDPHTADPDAAAAAAAVVEGDAVLTHSMFQLVAIDLEELLNISDEQVAASQEALEAAPPFLAAQLLFPYNEGLGFVCERQRGGWSAVDDLYRDPPTTTAQILFPERYDRREAAADAPDPIAPDGAGWEEVRRQTFGAADLMFLFDIAGVDGPREAAAAWAGGEMVQWRRGDEVAVRLSFVEHADAAPGTLCEAVTEWVSTRPDGAATCDGPTVAVSL